MFKQHWEMLNVLELQSASDSLSEVRKLKQKELTGFIYPFYYFSRAQADSTLKVAASNKIKVVSKEPDISSHFTKINTQTFYGNAINATRSVKNIIEYSIIEYKELYKLQVRHKIEWHRKFILSIACMVMFFIGAPLGSIIRKGGFGLPIVVSVLFYVCYHIVSLSGEKAAKTLAWTPFQGMWLGIAVFVPIGFFITWKASNDSKLFNIDLSFLLDKITKIFKTKNQSVE
jgi:lipopolysaccharide export system permease protein